MIGFDLTFQIAYLSTALAIFSIAAFLTRARARRIAGAIVATLAFAAISAPIDLLGRYGGWWIFPSCTEPPHPPLAIYLGQALIFVGVIALVAWRVQRHFGARGLRRLAVLVCGVGLVRDFSCAAFFPALIRFGEVPASAIADLCAWAIVVFVAVTVSRAVAGPASDDAPRSDAATRAR